MLSNQFIAKTRRMKGFIITFQWVNGEPSMCLLREFNGRKSAWVIPLSMAFKYADLSYLIPISHLIANHFGMHGERQAARNIADVILEHIEDLVKSRPEPKEATIARLGPMIKPEFNERTRTVVLH